MKLIGQTLGAIALAVFGLIALIFVSGFTILLSAAIAYILGTILMYVPIFSDVVTQLLPIEKTDIPALFVLAAVIGSFFKSNSNESDSE